MSAYDFVQHGQELVEGQQYQEAVKICRLGLLAHPTAIAGRLVLGAALMFLRRYDEVLAEMRVALEIDGSNPRALGLKGEALMYKGDPMQAAEVIEHALVYAPDDRKLRKLMQHVEILLATTDPSEYARLDHGTMTKNYPVHRGYDDDDGDDYDYDDDYDALTNDGNSITRPRSPGDAFRRYGDDRGGQSANAGSGTMDIDPYAEGYELNDYATAPSSDDSMEMTRALDTHAMGGRARVDYDDFDDDLGPLAPPPTRAPPPQELRPSSGEIGEQTSHYHKAPEADGPPRSPLQGRNWRPEVNAPVPVARDRSGAARNRELPLQANDLASHHDRQVARRRTQPGRLSSNKGRPPALPAPLPAPPIDQLFDADEEGGVSRILLDSDMSKLAGNRGGVAQAVKQVRKPNQPTLAISGADRAAAGVGVGAAPPPRPPVGMGSAGMQGMGMGPAAGPGPGPGMPPGANPALGMDMQRLRGGQPPPATNSDEPGLLESIVELDVENSPYAFPKATAPKQPAPAAKQPAQPAAQAPVAVAPSDMTASMPKKRSPLTYVLYAVIALAVVAGGVFAGFKIREIRLDRQIRNTETDAATFAREDTFDGYTRARAAYARIVSVRSNPRTRSALARMDAALAGEFGEEYERASESAGALSNAENVDIAVARAYLALARGDADSARDLAQKLSKEYPDEAMGPYLTGRAALMVGDLEKATEAFERASDLDKRPITQLGRGRTYRAKGEYDRAGRIFDSVLDITAGHPDALIERAQIIVARGNVDGDIGKTQTALQRIADGAPDDGPTRPARRQRAMAALTLASIAVLRNEAETAEKALAQVSELMPKDDRQFSVALTTALLSAGDDKDAAKEAARALEKWPDDLPVRIAAAQVAIRRGKPDRAVELLDRDIAGNAQALTTRGQAYQSIGLLEKAAADLDAALDLSPKRVETLLARARTDLGEGKAEMAVKRLEPIYGDEARPEIAVVYAAALREFGKPKEAKAILERLVKLPRSGQAQLELARLERQEGRYKSAKAAYKTALEALVDSSEVKLEAALLSFDIGEIQKANDSLKELLEEAPQNPQVLLEAARIATLTGDFEQAQPLIDAADKLPAAPRWQVVREQIRIAFRQGNYALAQQSASAIVQELKDEDEEIWLLLLEAQLSDDKPKAARKTKDLIYKRFAQGTPVRFLARAQLATYESRTKDALDGYRKAAKALKKLRASPRRKAYVSYWIGRAYLGAGKYADASKSLKTAVDRDPGHFEAYLYLAEAERERKRWKAAEKAYRGALAIDATSAPEARYNLGEMLYNQKRWGPAKREFKAYIKKYPRGDYAGDARKYLRRLK